MAREYNLSKTTGVCNRCGKELRPGQSFVATVTEANEELLREDFCPDCWQAAGEDKRTRAMGVWQSRVPQPQEKKKLFIDDEMLVQFFHRLGQSDDPAMVNFRFVLALVLMRKKLLIYERAVKTDEGLDAWMMRLRGTDQTYQVIDPHMDEEKIAQVSGQLGAILEEDL